LFEAISGRRLALWRNECIAIVGVCRGNHRPRQRPQQREHCQITPGLVCVMTPLSPAFSPSTGRLVGENRPPPEIAWRALHMLFVSSRCGSRVEQLEALIRNEPGATAARNGTPRLRWKTSSSRRTPGLASGAPRARRSAVFRRNWRRDFVSPGVHGDTAPS